MRFDADARFQSVEFDEYSWYFTVDDGSVAAIVEGFWRYLVDGRVVRASIDHDEEIDEAAIDLVVEMNDALEGRQLQRVEIDDTNGDLRLFFSGGATLEMFTSSSEYESWQLVIGGTTYTCGGGGVVQ